MKKILSTLIVFVISVCNVFGAISKQGIINAINEGRLGDYLLIENADAPGVQEFLDHCVKHYGETRDRHNDTGNQPNRNSHTVLTVAKISPHELIRAVLNCAKASNFEIIAYNMNNQLPHQLKRLILKQIKVKDVIDKLVSSGHNMQRTIAQTKVSCFGKKHKTLDYYESKKLDFSCAIYFKNIQLNQLYINANNVSGYCYVNAPVM